MGLLIKKNILLFITGLIFLNVCISDPFKDLDINFVNESDTYADLVVDYYLSYQLLGDYEFFKEEYENALFNYERSLLINNYSIHSRY